MNRRRVATQLLLAGVLAALVTAGPAPAQAADDPVAFTASKTVTRDVLAADGTLEYTDERTVTVTADVTQSLRGRQVMTLNWKGAHPSSNIVGNVLSLDAWTSTEYPVVVLQCRGDDDSADESVHISPETCWTTIGGSQRRLGGTSPGDGDIYRHDKYATAAETAASVPSAEDWQTVCGEGDEEIEPPGSDYMSKRIVPFFGANGTQYWTCGGESHGQAPEMGVTSALGANEKAEVTRTDGTGYTHVEVRTAAENASLGCSATVPCAIVVIPIMGITCDSGNKACNQQGVQPAGSTWREEAQVSAAVTGRLWSSASNWRNRITIPITIAPVDSACKDASGRTTVQLYGSALLSEAAEQWASAYCSRSDRFVLRINDQVEATAFHNLKQGYGSGVVASYKESSASPSTLGYAPIAVTGFAIAFVVDIPDGGGQLQELRLSPRLLAKLMTGSYPGTRLSKAARAERPDLADNPVSLQFDPEFKQLNPALDSSGFVWNQPRLSFSQLMGTSVPSDLMRSLTSYIAADPEAAAFLAGAADPWGMTVNRAYKGIALPLSDWPLADSWLMPGVSGCDATQPTPWFSKVLAPVSDLHRLAQDLLAATPEAIYLNVVIPNTDICKSYRQPALPQGNRAMIALVTLADAERFALPTASLRTTGTGAGATFVAPSTASLSAAASLFTSAGAGEPFTVDASKVVSSSFAYPGTMVVHAALPVTGLDTKTATAASDFVKTAVTEGQVQGTGSGELPAGYLPITSGGSTAALYAAADAVQTAVARQSGSMSATPSPTSAAPTATGSGPATTGSSQANLSTGGSAPAAAVDSRVLASDGAAVAGLPAPAASATAGAASAGTTPAAAVQGPLRAVLPTGVALAALAGVGIPLLRRTPRGEP